VRLLLYDRDPRSHHVDVTKLENIGLYWQTPGDELPNLKQFGAVLVHISDDKHFKQDITINAIKNGLLLVIFSGDAGITSDAERLLKAQYPMARICTISVRDLQSNIEAALIKQDLEELCWDRLSDVHELLSTLWALDLHWEKQGRPSVVTNSDGTFSLGTGERTLTDSNEMLSLAELAALRTTNGRRLRTLSSRIYRRSPKPNTDFQILAVSNHHEYHLGVAHLRDSLLAWARSSE
jgi:hypothetical protein